MLFSPDMYYNYVKVQFSDEEFGSLWKYFSSDDHYDGQVLQTLDYLQNLCDGYSLDGTGLYKSISICKPKKRDLSPLLKSITVMFVVGSIVSNSSELVMMEGLYKVQETINLSLSHHPDPMKILNGGH